MIWSLKTNKHKICTQECNSRLWFDQKIWTFTKSCNIPITQKWSYVTFKIIPNFIKNSHLFIMLPFIEIFMKIGLWITEVKIYLMENMHLHNINIQLKFYQNWFIKECDRKNFFLISNKDVWTDIILCEM